MNIKLKWWISAFLRFLTVGGALVLAAPYFWPLSIERKFNTMLAVGELSSLPELARGYQNSTCFQEQALAQAYLGYAEFLAAQDSASKDPRGVFFQLQSVKNKISSSLELVKKPEAQSRWNIRLKKKVNTMLSEIIQFEQKNLGHVLQALRQEQQIYQQQAKMKTYEAWGREARQARKDTKAK